MLTPFLLASLVAIPDAAACSPGSAVVVGHSPLDGAEDVPTDAVIQIAVGEGYVEGVVGERVTVSIDGEAVTGTTTEWNRTLDLVEQIGIITFTADAPFPAGAAVDVVVGSPGFDNTDTAFSFAVGDTSAGSVASAPELSDVYVADAFADTEQMSSCEQESWREMSFTVRASETLEPALSWLVLHRVDGGVVSDTPFDFVGPITDTAWEGESRRNFYDIERDLADECFVAFHVDAAGRSSAASSAVCVDLDAGKMWESEKGCSALPRSGAALLGMLAAAFGLVGRRRR